MKLPDSITHCLVWGENYPATGHSYFSNNTALVKSDRAGGVYKISWEAWLSVRKEDDTWKARLTTWLIDQREKGVQEPFVKTDIVALVNQQCPICPLPPHVRAERLFRFLVGQAKPLGESIKVTAPNYHDYNADPRLAYASLAWSESFKWEEVLFLFDAVRGKGWVKGEKAVGGNYFKATVTMAGHRHLEELVIQSASPQVSITNTRNKRTQEYKYDFFIAHASEDKKGFVRPLVKALQDREAKVWYDEFELRVGMSLRQEIDRGLASSRFGVVVLSQHFFAKEWPQQELNGLWSLDPNPEGEPRILPIWHEVSREDIVHFSPMLADRVALNTSPRSADQIADELLERK